MNMKLEQLKQQLKELEAKQKILQNISIRKILGKLSGKWGFQTFDIDFGTSRSLSFYGKIREWKDTTPYILDYSVFYSQSENSFILSKKPLFLSPDLTDQTIAHYLTFSEESPKTDEFFSKIEEMLRGMKI